MAPTLSESAKRVCIRAVRTTSHPQASQPTRLQRWQSTTTSNPMRSISTTASLSATQASNTNDENRIQPAQPKRDRLPTGAVVDDVSSLPPPDTMSSHAWQELASHRELREVVRLAAWEMPLLGSLSKPFKPPNPSLTPLRWRYTTYMGESHPAQAKVVVEFDPNRLPGLSDKQRLKLAKLAGTRYDGKRGTIKISCDTFEMQAQNKRWLAERVEKLVAEARDEEGDGFEDVPLDTRHWKVKRRLKFPDEWKMTEERRRMLAERRKETVKEEATRVEQKQIVSGVNAIDDAREKEATEEATEQPVMVEARRGLPANKARRRR